MALRPRHIAVAAAGLAYVAISQWLLTRTPPSAWSAVALLAPMFALVAVGAWRSGKHAWSVCAALVVVGLALQAEWGGGLAPERLYLLQHLGTHLGLALGFAATLRRGSRALISRLADQVHHGLTPAMEDYTRKVTAAWAIYFAAMAALSLGLYLGAPFSLWAAFANLVTPLAALLTTISSRS